jgi:hypothetical protein
MHWNQNDLAHVMLFDRAIAMRDAGDFPEALRLLEELVAQLTKADTFLLLNARLQLGQVLQQLGRDDDADVHVRWVVSMAPTLEQASLALFQLLAARSAVEALKEAVRFLAMRESVGYRELFEGGAYADDSDADDSDADDSDAGAPNEERELAEKARALLAKHRDAQRARAAPIERDTVRIRATAPAELRPGSLASVHSVQGALVRLQFADGEIVDVPAAFVDHRDI